jgi:hypothetical protein
MTQLRIKADKQQEWEGDCSRAEISNIIKIDSAIRILFKRIATKAVSHFYFDKSIFVIRIT